MEKNQRQKVLLQRHWHTQTVYQEPVQWTTDRQANYSTIARSKVHPYTDDQRKSCQAPASRIFESISETNTKTNIACRPEEVAVVFRLTESFHEERFPFNQKKTVSHKFWASFFSTKDFAHGFLLQILLDRYLVGSTLRRMLFYGNESTPIGFNTRE